MRPMIKKVQKEFKRFTPDIFIDEGFDLSKYGYDAEVIHIPGHSKGSLGILTKDNSLICGDILVNMKKPGTLLFADDFNVLNKSIERLKKMNIQTVYPGHGKPFQMELFLKKR